MSAPDLPPVLAMLHASPDVPAQLVAGLAADGVLDADDLTHALATQRVRALSDGDATVVRRIRRALHAWPARPRTRTLREARESAVRVLERLQQDDNALRLAVTGGVRRMEPVVSSVRLMATAHDPSALIEAFYAMPFVAGPMQELPPWHSVRLDDGTLVDLCVAPEDATAWFVRWIETTGPHEHVQALRERAISLGIAWSDAGLTKDGKAFSLQGEDDVYAALRLEPVAPEARGADVTRGSLPLVDAHALAGVAHVHTHAGAGSASLEATAERAGREGYGWIWITDAGLDDDARAAQAVAARNWNLKRDDAALEEGARAPPVVLVGAEVPLTAHGVKAGPDVQGAIGRIEGDAAGRGLASMLAQPALRVLGHPDARALRAWGLVLDDWLPVFAACKAHDVAVEVSGQVRRMRYPDGWHEAARAKGVRLLIGADAYEPDDLDAALIALGQARRGGWAPGEVLNTLGADAIRSWLEA